MAESPGETLARGARVTTVEANEFGFSIELPSSLSWTARRYLSGFPGVKKDPSRGDSKVSLGGEFPALTYCVNSLLAPCASVTFKVMGWSPGSVKMSVGIGSVEMGFPFLSQANFNDVPSGSLETEPSTFILRGRGPLFLLIVNFATGSRFPCR